MTGVVCILMGCGIPTTANYIIMVTVAAPTLVIRAFSPGGALLRVLLRRAGRYHPPVVLAAYARRHGRGDPFKT